MAKKGSFKKGGKWFTSTSGLTQGDINAQLEIKANNTKIVKAAINRALIAGLTECGMRAEGFAKKLCPVDTGRLRNSITYQLDGDRSVYIGTNVEYARAQELGYPPNHLKPQPYLRPAVQDHEPLYRRILQKHLRNG